MNENHISDVNKSLFVGKDISHADFVAGMQSGAFKLIITDVIGDAYDICTRKNKNILAIVKAVCGFLLPLLIIVISIVTYNWWLLFGVVISWLTPAIILRYGRMVKVYLLLLNIGYWLKQGFRFQDYFTFFSLTFIAMALLWEIEVEYNFIFAKRSLIDDPKLFREAIDQSRIIIERIK